MLNLFSVSVGPIRGLVYRQALIFILELGLTLIKDSEY